VNAWDVQVVLCAEDLVEIHATFDGQALTSARRLSMGSALRQLEQWLAGTPHADMFLAVRTPDGVWRHIATRRWRVAAYFVLTHYERTFVNGPLSADEDVPSESVRVQSGVVLATGAKPPKRSNGTE
jgi:hypothetical protein